MISKYQKLLNLWKNYRAAINGKPYNADKVQAWGLAFAGEWNERKADICNEFKIDLTEFDYNMRYDVMKKVTTTYGILR